MMKRYSSAIGIGLLLSSISPAMAVQRGGFLSSWGENWRIAVEPSLGMAFFNIKDFKTSGQTAVADAQGDPDQAASFDEFGTSFLLGASLRLEHALHTGHWVGLGVGYNRFLGGTYEQSETRSIATNNVRNLSLDVSARAIPVTFYYKIGIEGLGMNKRDRSLEAYIGAGPSFYSATVDYDETETETAQPTRFERGELKDSTIGAHIVAGAECRLADRWGIAFDIVRAFAKLDDLAGPLTDDAGTTVNRRLIMDRDAGSGLESLDVRNSNLPLAANQRGTELSLSGFQINLRARYYF